MLDGFRLPQPDRSPIYEWAARNVTLPPAYAINGHFNVGSSPWMIDIFDALQNPSVRVVTNIKAIQSGGSLVSDIWIPWIIANDPGPISLTMHTDDLMEVHAKTRLNPLLEGCEVVANMLPPKGPNRTTTEIYFGGFFLVMNAANLSDQQSQSIRYKINDEIWHPKWQSVYSDAVGRVTKFEELGLSKIYNVSQAGFVGDVADKAFKDGTEREWGYDCESCKKFVPLHFAIRNDGGDKSVIGGVVWDKKAKGDDGLWNVSRAAESAHFECPHCRSVSADTDATRARWRKVGKYSIPRSGASPHNVSFHVESLPMRPMGMLVTEWLNAVNEKERSGNDEYVIKFRQKREAKPFVIEKTAINVLAQDTSCEYSTDEYKDGKAIPGEVQRNMTIDRQQTHFWVEIGAFAQDEYRQLFFGKIDTSDSIRELQRRYGIPDSGCAEDRRYMPSHTDSDCARYGWRGLMGVPRKTWTMKNEETGEMENFPYSDLHWSNIGGIAVPYYEFSSDHCKDIFSEAIQRGKPIKWRLPKDVSRAYLEHIKSEEKVEVSPGKWRWKEVKQNANHGLDTSSMMGCIGVICGLIRFKLGSDSA